MERVIKLDGVIQADGLVEVNASYSAYVDKEETILQEVTAVVSSDNSIQRIDYTSVVDSVTSGAHLAISVGVCEGSFAKPDCNVVTFFEGDKLKVRVNDTTFYEVTSAGLVPLT